MTQTSIARLLCSSSEAFTPAVPFNEAALSTRLPSLQADRLPSNPWQKLGHTGLNPLCSTAPSLLDKPEIPTRARLLVDSSPKMPQQGHEKFLKDLGIKSPTGLTAALVGNPKNWNFLEELGRVGKVEFNVMAGGTSTPPDGLAMTREPLGDINVFISEASYQPGSSRALEQVLQEAAKEAAKLRTKKEE